MQHRSIKPYPVGDRIRGTSIFYNSNTAFSDWRNCSRCALQYGRRRVCLRYDGIREYRRQTPIRLMFIGEAPGRTENDTGVPFQGQSGRILTQIFDYTRTAFRILITNVVCCQPKDLVQVNNKDFLDVDFTTVPLDSKDPDYEKRRRAIAATLTAENHNRNPAPFEIRACAPHITELEREYHPQGIVLLGLIATQAKISTQCPILNLKHPAAIARMEFKVIPMKQEARKLQKFIEEIRENS